MNQPRLLLLLVLLLPGGCTERPGQHEAELYVFGTLVSLTAAQTGQETAAAAFSEIGARFQEMHRDWHAWEPGALTKLNAAFANGSAADTGDGIIDLVHKSQLMESASGGRFNAAIGGLIELWGFHTSEYPVLGPPPSEQEIASFLAAAPSSLNIEITGNSLRSSNPAVQLDFGGIAKGAAVDEAIDILRRHGIPSAIVNAGGDLRAYGSQGNRAWKIAVQAPGGGVLGSVEVQGDEAIFTSGNYQRFRKDNERRYAHILDPATGWPVDGISASTVVAREGWRADAAATALLIGGADSFAGLARDLQISDALLIGEDGELHMTPSMARRLTLLDPERWRIQIHP